MTNIEIIHLISDVLFIGWSALIIIGVIVVLVKGLWQASDKEADEESDVYIEKLNKLQETVDLLASKHLDSEAMRELIKIKKEDEV